MLALRTFIHLLILVSFLVSPLPGRTQEVAPGGPVLSVSPVKLQQTLSETHKKYQSLKDGKVYISGSEQVDPDLFGIAIATVDGQVFKVGDADTPFPIQSLSKLFVYGL